MAPVKVTVFGGTGFLGQRVVQRLLERGLSVRVAVRHPERIAALLPALHFDAIQADVNDDRSVAAAVAGVEGVVNAVSLYAESGSQTFHSVHVEAATRVARLAREAGVGRFIHVSGIGADAESASPYIRSRGKGEKAVREAFPATTLIRPSIMFGRGDAFLIPIARMLRRLPVFPLFGRGQTQLQPAYVGDVADAIARVMQNAQSLVRYDLGGPRVYTYRSLLEVIARHLRRKPLLVPIPFGLWHALASVAEMLPEPPITRNQVELMQLDNLTAPGVPGFGDLRISSTSLEDTLPSILGLSGGLPPRATRPIVQSTRTRDTELRFFPQEFQRFSKSRGRRRCCMEITKRPLAPARVYLRNTDS